MMDDATLLATCIADEAAGEPYEGKVAVGRVIRNRMAAHYESDGTVVGTVLKKWQFSGFWAAMVAGKYTEVAFTPEDALARAQTLYAGFSTQGVWGDCVKAVGDSIPGSGFVGGPEFQKLDDRTFLYFNPAVCARPAWATPETLVCTIFRHEFHHG